jgi:hypothetical protein
MTNFCVYTHLCIRRPNEGQQSTELTTYRPVGIVAR